MTWWWLTCSRFTVGVAVDADEVIMEGPPIVRRFIGQPSRNLGRWMRSLGEFKAERLNTSVYRWGNNPRRAELKGRECVIEAKGALGSVLLRFLDTDERVVSSYRSVA